MVGAAPAAASMLLLRVRDFPGYAMSISSNSGEGRRCWCRCRLGGGGESENIYLSQKNSLCFQHNIFVNRKDEVSWK